MLEGFAMAWEACASRKGIVCLGCVAGGRVAQQLDDIRNRSRGYALADKTPAAIAEGAEPILLGVATLPTTVMFCNVFKRASMSNRPVAPPLHIRRGSDSVSAQALEIGFRVSFGKEGDKCPHVSSGGVHQRLWMKDLLHSAERDIHLGE